jgi:hypothetical protein
MSKIQVTENGTRKEAIIQQAAGLFRQKGFAGSSMRELAERIGVEAPSLYNHIGSKNELLENICFSVANQFMAQLERIDADGLSPIQQLEQVLRFHIHMMVHAYDEVFVANHEWQQLKQPFLSDFLQQRKNYEQRLITMVQAGIAEGLIKPVQPQIAVLTILSAVRGLEFWQGQKNNIHWDELENNMVDHLLNGLVQ